MSHDAEQTTAGAGNRPQVATSDVWQPPSTGKRRLRKAGRFLRHPIHFTALVIVLLAVAAAVARDGLAPFGPEEYTGLRLSSPTAEHPFGTDSLARDQLSRIIYGARSVVTVATAAMLLGISISIAIGLISGTLRGWVDLVLQRFVDLWLAFPGLVLLMTLIAVLGPSNTTLIFALGLSLGVGSSRIVRGAVLQTSTQDFILAAQAVGASHPRIMLRHIFPSVVPTVIVLMSVNIGNAILAEASLSFLGLGVQPPRPSWGGMLSSDPQFLVIQPWLAVFPGLTITLVVFAFNMLGDGLRDLLDPRL